MTMHKEQALQIFYSLSLLALFWFIATWLLNTSNDNCDPISIPVPIKDHMTIYKIKCSMTENEPVYFIRDEIQLKLLSDIGQAIIDK